MNAEKFFNEHSLEEISKKTKISPISLRFIKNKEFDKIPRVKFVGFIKLIEREFGVDLNGLIEEYDSLNNTNKKEKKTPKQTEEKRAPKKSFKEKTPPPKENEKNEKKPFLFFLIVILLIISAVLLYIFTKKPNTKNSLTQKTAQLNTSLNTSNKAPATEQNLSIPKTSKASDEINVSTETNLSIQKNRQNSVQKTQKPKNTIPKEVIIIPNKLVWYKAVNLDTNKTYEYLTSKTKTLPGANYYIKFGHGNITIEYGDKNITPQTKKIVRILLKDGNYTYVKKGYK